TFALVRQEGNPEMTVDRFYGGIVHRGFMATKLVSHPHWHDHDNLPEGWTGHFAACLQDCVLPGFSVFSDRHALDAATTLLKKHKVRFKNPFASGGAGQNVIDTVRSLDCFLAAVSEGDIAKGLVLEEDVEIPPPIPSDRSGLKTISQPIWAVSIRPATRRGMNFMP